VAANVNGCLTPLDSVEVVLLLAVMPVNDVFTSSVGDLDTFNVFLNDGITDPSSYEICTLTPDPLPAGVNYLGNGLFAFQETTGENVSFTYQICYCDQSGEVATVTIMVQDDSCSFIPNIITPNDDGLNDWFTIPCLNGRNFSENSLVIYNQWGDKVFEDTGYTNDPTDATHPAWKGTLNNKEGKDLPDGVYYYIFKPSPNDPAIKGFVEIFR
jgi:gliding motility-associated-like protein